jgi:hypothetical protein
VHTHLDNRENNCGVIIVVVAVMVGKRKSMFVRSSIDVSEFAVAPTAIGYGSVHCIDHREVASDMRKRASCEEENHHVIGHQLQLTVKPRTPSCAPLNRNSRKQH